MSKESKHKLSKSTWISILFLTIVIPATLLISWKMGDRKYYLCSVLLIVYAMVPFFLQFEKKKPQPRELVTLAVMCAIVVASRVAFIAVPNFKPMIGILIITGIAFGPESGFLAGALSAFVSNFIFGQGPWTPWQMFAYGFAGFISGVLKKKGILKGEESVSMAIYGGLLVLICVGPLLDTCSVFTMNNVITKEGAAAVYLAGLPMNVMNAGATILTLLILGKPLTQILERIKLKYGLNV